MEALLSGEYKVFEPHQKEGIRLEQLRRDTSNFSMKRSPNCSSSILRAEPTRSRWLFKVRCRESYSKASGHIVRIKALPGRAHKLAQREVAVSCSCPFWTYWGPDYNAAEGGFSESIRSNGSSPDIRDPGRQNLVCKHVYLAGQDAARFIVTDKEKAQDRVRKRREERETRKVRKDREEKRQEELTNMPEYLL